ncbi:hypothetical protein ASC97_04350 [Rhizobium sp. Root1203]|nr:hypothetical protein ASC97_04350 [Rhizobium sp. Root1203]
MLLGVPQPTQKTLHRIAVTAFRTVFGIFDILGYASAFDGCALLGCGAFSFCSQQPVLFGDDPVVVLNRDLQVSGRHVQLLLENNFLGFQRFDAACRQPK